MKPIALLFCMLQLTVVFSQAPSFEKCYEPIYTSGFNSITHDSSGYFYAVGSSGRAFDPLVFVKLDREGNFLLENYFYFNDINNIRNIQYAPDGNLVAIGDISGCDVGESAGLVVKISPTGNVLWAKTMNPIPLGVPGNNTPNSCIALRNGNILVVTDTILNFFSEFGDSLRTIYMALRPYAVTDGFNDNIVCLNQSGIVILDSSGQQINFVPNTIPISSIKLLPDSTYLANSGNSLLKIDSSFNLITQIDLTTINLSIGASTLEPGKIWIGNLNALCFASFDYNLQLIDSFHVQPNGVDLSSYSVVDTTLMVVGAEYDRNSHSYIKSYSTSGNYTTYNTDLALINLSFDTLYVGHPASLPPEVYTINFVARLTVQNTGVDTIQSFYANAESMLFGPCGNFGYVGLIEGLNLAPGQTTSVPIDTLGEYGIVITNFPYVYEFCTWISCPNFKVDQDHSNNYLCDTAIFLDPTGVHDFYASYKLDIYPNPFNSKISIRVSEEMLQNTTYEVYNLIGELKQSGWLTDKENILDLSGLSSGVYFITILSGEISISRKIIKI